MVAGDGTFFTCAPSSRLFRSTVVRLQVAKRYPPLSVEVLDMRCENELLDEMQRPIPWRPEEALRLH